MQYRFRLGKTLNNANIIDDELLNNACGVSWTCGTNWTIAAGKATHTGAFGYLSQDCGFVPGVRYNITFTIEDIPAPGGADYIQLYLSGFSVTTNQDNNYYKDANGVYTVYGTCLSATDSFIRFGASGDVSISYCVAYAYDWNEPLTNEPMNWDSSGISLIKSELLEGFYVKYIGNLEFWGDGYDYLLAQYNTLEALSPKEFCEKIYLKIERLVSGTWEEHFTGIIYMNKCNFDLKKNIVTASVEDVASSQVIKFGSEKILGMHYQNKNVYDAVLNFDYPSVSCQVRQIGGGTVNRYVYFLFKVLRFYVHEITDLAVTIDSDLLLTTPYDGGANVFQFMGITPFKNFANTTPTYTIFSSFQELTTDLNIIRNIGGLSSYPNDIPTLNIESKQTLQGTTYSYTIDNNKAEFSFYEEDNNFQYVEIGYARPSTDDLKLIDIGAYVQLENWEIVDYYSETKCTEQKLTLLSTTSCQPQWIYNQCINTEYDQSVSPATGLQAPFVPRNFWLQMQYSAPNYVSRFAAYGGNDYNNPDLETADIMTRQVFSLNSSFVSGITKTNDPIIRVWEFEAPLTLAQLDEIIANPNYQIQMTSEYFTGTISGYIVEFEKKNKSDSAGQSTATLKIIST